MSSVSARLDGSILIVRIPMRLQRCGGRKRIVVPDGSELAPRSKPQPDGTLVSRRRPGAVLDDEGAIVGQALRLARSGQVVAVNGEVVAVRPRSLCLHGDSPGAAALAAAVRRALSEAGAAIAPFA